jgi:N-methylhydantoinase A
MSGPAAGVLAGAFFGKLLGQNSVLTLDMGGTSCDVSLIQNGSSPYTSDYEIDFGIPIKTPIADIHTIGAGGGSIGWVDKGGLLHVGPHSAGADPGPACYGEGGKEPTVTDANLSLKRLNPNYFLGAKMKLNADIAREVTTKLAERVGMDPHETAEAMLTIAVHNMANALSLISTQRGIDPREFTLFAFGGAGGLHAAKLASVLGISEVVIPIYPGNTSSIGLLTADLRVDFAKSILLRSDQPDVLERVNECLPQLRKQAFEELHKEGFSGEPKIIQALQMRYYWQNYSRSITVPSKENLTEEDLLRCYEAFHRDHKEFYGFNMRKNVVEIVEISGTLVGPVKPLKLKKTSVKKRNVEPEEIRKVYINNDIGFVDVPVFRRVRLFPGFSINGPSIIEEPFSTTLVLPQQNASIDEYGNIRMSIDTSK